MLIVVFYYCIMPQSPIFIILIILIGLMFILHNKIIKKKNTNKYTHNVNQKKVKEKERTPQNYMNIELEKYIYYIQNEDEILSYFYEHNRFIDYKIQTTGESTIYKEKLKDIRWLRLSDRIKKRDHYCCQHCFNIQQLRHINDLYSIVDFEEVAANVIETYYQLMSYEFHFETYRMLSFNSNFVYVKKHNIWLTQIEEKGRNILEDASINDYRTSYSIISETKCNPNNEYVYSHKTTMPMRYKAKNGIISYTNKLLIERNMYTKFSSNMFIYHRIDYCNKSHCDFIGRATLFFNEYAITFPLYHLKSHESLNVHHKKYAESGNPWDVHENDLITLCYKCHILEHQETIK